MPFFIQATPQQFLSTGRATTDEDNHIHERYDYRYDRNIDDFSRKIILDTQKRSTRPLSDDCHGIRCICYIFFVFCFCVSVPVFVVSVCTSMSVFV